MMMRRPLYIADTSKSSKWRDRHKSTLIPGFLTSITTIRPLSPSESPILEFSQEEGGQNMDLFPLPIQRMRPRQKGDLERALQTEFCLPMVYFKFSMQIPMPRFGNANKTYGI